MAAMHYIGMAAMTYQHANEAPTSLNGFFISPLGIAMLVAGTFSLLAVTLVASLLNRQLSSMNGQIRQSEARYRELFEQNPLPAWIYDREKNGIVEVNEAAIQHYGWSRDEFLEQNPHARAASSDYSNNSRSPGAKTLCQHRTRDGRSIWVEVVGKDISNAQTSSCLIIVHDVTSWSRLNKS